MAFDTKDSRALSGYRGSYINYCQLVFSLISCFPDLFNLFYAYCLFNIFYINETDL